MEGLTQRVLDQAVLSAAGWRPNLPRASRDGQVGSLLRSCDRRRALGRRDYAILVLLVRLGLRGGEVVWLELDDVDWRIGEILVRGKGRRQDRLPFRATSGQHWPATSKRGRPQSASRRVFLRHQAPSSALPTPEPSAVCSIAPADRAGIDYVVSAPPSSHRGKRDAASRRTAVGDRPGPAPPQPDNDFVLCESRPGAPRSARPALARCGMSELRIPSTTT